MIEILILPTRELVRELSPMDSFFYFVSGGVKGVILDAVLEYGDVKDPMDEFLKSTRWKPLVDRVIFHYENTLETTDFDQSEYNNTVGNIEFIVSNIQKNVRDLLGSLEVGGKISFQDRSHMWLDDDLVLKYRRMYFR